MSRNDLNMEDLFRSKMESFAVDPSPGLWQKVHTKILWKQFFSFSLQTFNVYYLAAAISLAGIGGYALISNAPDSPVEESASIPSVNLDNLPAGQPSDAADPEKEGSYIIEKEIDKQSSKSQPEKAELATADKTREITNTSGSKDADKSSEIQAETPVSEQPVQATEIQLVSADFEGDLLSGCSPLAVNFKNLSENAILYNWTFSDGGSSSDKDPSYVFDEPGEFPVSLKVTGNDGKEDFAEKIIIVYETPKALFELDETADLMNKQPVYFYNYSRGADYFEWDFGDDQGSNLAEPIHYYDQPGSYNVRLIAWTDHQCYDSLLIQNAFTGPESEINFPNAFTPNMSGPTGGYYDINDIYNSVFHPVVSGDLIEYHLKIFNRQGLLIFESNDLAFGWDGYYQEKLAAQQVYIWKVRGKFSNGKTFVKSGDITLIRQR